MAAEVSADLGLIQDEDILRRMWQQTEDFGRKKEIRARMYKLREQRLKDFYTTGEVVSDAALTARKHTATNHADSIADQGFLSMKTKEIRDSESPTRDIHRRQAQNNYWNTVQESYSTADDGGRISDTYERSVTGQGVSPDGRTQSRSAVAEKQQQSSLVEETKDSSKQEEQKSRYSEAAVNAHTKTEDGGEMFTSAKKQEEQKQSSSVTTSKTGNTTYYSSSKKESSSSSSSSRQAVSSSTTSTYQILPSGERVLVSTTTSAAPKAITGENEVRTSYSNVRDDSDHHDTTDHIVSSTTRAENVTSSDRTEHLKNVRNSENVEVKSNVSDTTQFIINEKVDSSARDGRDVTSTDHRSYDTNVTERDVSSRRDVRNNEVTRNETESTNVVDQKIMTELHKLDSYLSTQNTTGTSTPVSPRSVPGDAANWTVVSSSDGEFIYKGDAEKTPSAPFERPVLIKHPSSLDLPKDITEGQYVTTYQQSYQPKKISVEHSPTHDAFARSLRASPPPSSTRSSSKGSLDRSSPDRKFQKGGSPTRKSPDKERRVSVAGSYTIEKPKEVKRKVSETTQDFKKDTTVKAKRKFSTTQTKTNTKVRASTPGTSPSTSPTRMARDRSSSPSSGSESDSSQLTYSKKTSTIRRTDVRKSGETTRHQTSPERSSTPRSPSRKSPSPSRKSPSPAKTSGILRKDSKTESSSTILIRSESPVKGKPKSPSVSPDRTLQSRNKSPEQKPNAPSGTLTKKSSLKSVDKTTEQATIVDKTQVSSKTSKISSHHDVVVSVDVVPGDDTNIVTHVPTDNSSDLVTSARSTENIVTDENVNITNFCNINGRDKTNSTIEINIQISPDNFPQTNVTETQDITSDSITTQKTTGLSREDLILLQAKENNSQTTDTKTTTIDFIQNEKEDNTPIASPVHIHNLRDKSPEYSSEGSVSKEIKAARATGKFKAQSPDSSPERSAFTPIKGFRTSPERIDIKIKEHSHPAGAPSPVSPKPVTQKVTTNKEKSPKPQSRGTSPTKSPSPTRSVPLGKNTPLEKSPVRETKSSSISSYSSPERSPEKKTKSPDRKSTPQRPIEKPADKSKPDNYRPTRRSSIPRSEAKTETLTKKVSEKKIEIRQKPATRIPSFERKAPVQKSQTTRSDSQSSITRKTVTKTFKSTAVREVNTAKTITKTPSTTKVKTTAIINLQKPAAKPSPVQSRKPTTNTVVNITVTAKKPTTETGSKKPVESRKPTTARPSTIRDRKVVKKETTKEQKTVQKVAHKDEYDGSSDRSTSVSSPETVRPVDSLTKVQHDTTDFQHHNVEIKQQSNVALSLICSSNITSKHELNSQNVLKSNITDGGDLEDELPPEEFLVDDYDDDVVQAPSPTKFTRNEPQNKESPKVKPIAPKKPGPVQSPTTKKQPLAPVNKSPTKTTPAKVTKTPAPTKKPSFTQKLSSDSLTRSNSNKSLTKSTVTRKDTLKTDALNKNKTNVTTRMVTTETGIATKTVASPKPTTVKRPAVPQKKIPVEHKPDTSSSSSSEDEETDIPSEVTIITQDQQQYINELEEMRLTEEQEYASKVTATTNQEDSLLSVVIQLPKSSRESSPDYPSHSPFCTVSDDGGAHPRYADVISEPEDVEVFDVHDKSTIYNATNKRFEQVTDLDEESETEEKLNVSVADRVSKFLATSQAVNTTQKEDISQPQESPKTVRKEVLKAKHMFETIAKNQTAPPAPNNRPVDILSRPSVFEGRRGVTAPKEKFDTFPRRKSSKSPETIARTNSTNDLKEETIQSYNDTQIEERSTTQILRKKSISPAKEIPKEKDVPHENETPKVHDKKTDRQKSPSPIREVPTRKKSLSPEKEAQPNKDTTKEVPLKKQTPESKKPSISETKEQFTAKTREVTAKEKSEILSKRDFFERKAKVDQTTVTKGRTPKKEPAVPSKPVKSSPAPDSHRQTTDFIQSERKESSPRASPERKPSIPNQSKKSESPERKSSKALIAKEKFATETTTTTVTRKVSSDKKIDTVDRKVTASPTKDRRDSSRTSPERQLPKESKEHVKAKSPERTVRKDSVREKSPDKSTSPTRESKVARKASSPERSSPSERRSSIKRTSPERKVSLETSHTRISESAERTLINQQGDSVELNRAGRFGVTLRRTSSSSSTGTPRRSSTPGGDEIEDILQLELLEQMLEKAVGYEQRRRIRAQIRIVKKMHDDSEPETTTATTTTVRKTTTSQQHRVGGKSPTREPETKRPSKPAEDKKSEIRKSSIEQKPSQRPTSPTKTKIEPSSPKSSVDYTVSEPKRTASPTKPKEHSPVRQETVRKTTRTETTVTSSSTVRSQPREREPCPITSSYGVGPTDEHGRPLFGLKALRRSNTSKTLTDEVDHQEQQQQQQVEVTETEEVCDARGRPLFGLRALQVSTADTQEMPEVSSAQLRGLVERHEKNTRTTTTTTESQPRQKPKAKLRDSFILTQDEDTVEETQLQNSTVTPQRSGVSLRSLIQKHEDISTTGGTTHREIESKTTVVSSRSTVSSDGSVSLNRDVIKGELSARNGEEPTGKVVHSKYSFHTPDEKKNHGVATTVTTTKTIGGRRGSGPKITEIEDSEERRSSITSEKSSRRYSGAKVLEYEEDEEDLKRTIHDESQKISCSRRLSQDVDDGEEISGGGKLVSSAIRKFSKGDDEERWQSKTSSVTSSKFVSSSTSSSSVRKSNVNTANAIETKSKTASSVVQKQGFKDSDAVDKADDDDDDKKKPLVRGDSIRALQHKFQQATESTSSNSTPQRGYPPAGLILRTSSFKVTEDSPNMSSSLKQHSSATETKQRPNRTSPTGRRGSKTDAEETFQTTSKSVSSTTTNQVASEKSSFLDNTSRVTGVQDILQRMRNADLVVESGDTNEDAEARALLNKFLGASVILQGMEQGMKAAAQTNGHHSSSLPASPTSATLVSRVEKQRMASTNTTTSHQTDEDLENIWDEKQLRILLEACSDYDGRRKIRARLRNVMAEHKACADIVAVASDASGNSMLSQDCVESKQVSTKTEGSTVTHSEVHTRTTSSSFASQRMTKANSVTSPFAKFKQLERQNSAPSRAPSDTPIFKFTDPKLARSASTIKDRLLSWVQAQTKEYKNVQIENFSTSWSNGLAFCALIHHFCPEAFDYDQLTPEKRRHNFELAFRVAEEEADIAPLLDVEDMVVMRRPDWKCVFTYVQSVYRRFHSTAEAARP